MPGAVAQAGLWVLTLEGGVVVQVGAHFGTGFVVHLVDARGGKRPFIVSPFDQFMNE